jgi:hypothetical protein
VLYHRGALLLAVSGGDKLDTMPQEGIFMELESGGLCDFLSPKRRSSQTKPWMPGRWRAPWQAAFQPTG